MQSNTVLIKDSVIKHDLIEPEIINPDLIKQISSFKFYYKSESG